MKAADYGHIKWIKDLVPREMWIQQPIDYNKHALWGVSHWGRKRKQFYGLWNGTTTSIWIGSQKGDKDRAVAMIQAIEKMLMTRRIMRSLEKFVGGRL
nr:hypothetical protein [Tanacetum cinerariifolium]